MEEDLQKAFVSTNQQPALLGRRLLASVIPSLQKFNKADKPSDIWRQGQQRGGGMGNEEEEEDDDTIGTDKEKGTVDYLC